MALLQFTDKGIYCSKGDFYLDPWKPVHNALITHAHSDHARFGSAHYLAHELSVPVMQYRLGKDISVQSIKYNERLTINGVNVSFHPAGHIPGSSQIRVEYKDEIWVFTGDYKLMHDGISEAFEPVRCHHLISESTFALPIYKWKPQEVVFNEINEWWLSNKEKGIASIILGYALGKAQRILKNIDAAMGPIYAHGAIENINHIFRAQGFDLPVCERATHPKGKNNYAGALVLAPPSAAGSTWLTRFYPYSIGIASGWMRLRGTRRRKAADRGFVLSDHADWNELNTAIKESGAQTVHLTHGYTAPLARWLKEQGLEVYEEQTRYEGELAEISELTEEGAHENTVEPETPET